jgi:hypothetical protein
MDGITQCKFEILKAIIGLDHDKKGAEYDEVPTFNADDAFRRAFCLGALEAYKRALDIISGLTDPSSETVEDRNKKPPEAFRGIVRNPIGKIENPDHINELKTKGLTANMREILIHGMEAEESRPGFELVGFSYLDGTLTGYFVNPADLTYLHVWEVKISPDCKYVFFDTWREKMLIPIDGYKFPDDIFLTRDTGELNKMGFSISKGGKK